MMASEVIDFPDPDSPTNPSTSPAAIENDSPQTAAGKLREGKACVGTDALISPAERNSAPAGEAAAAETARPARDCGNSMVNPRTSSNDGTKPMVSALPLLLGPRFRRHQSRQAVIHHQLPVMFARVLDQTPSHIGDARLLILKRIDDQIIQALITLLLDRRRAVGKRFFHKLDNRGLCLVLLALRTLISRWLHPHRRIRKVIIRTRRMQQLFGKS